MHNFQVWVFGVVSKLIKLRDAVPNKDTLMAQAMVLANLLTFRRQVGLRNLSSSFSTSDKRLFMQSSVDSAFLFVEDNEPQARKNDNAMSTKSFHEVAAAALKNRSQQVESPLVRASASKPFASGYRESERPAYSFKKSDSPAASAYPTKGHNTPAPSKKGFRK